MVTLWNVNWYMANKNSSLFKVSHCVFILFWVHPWACCSAGLLHKHNPRSSDIQWLTRETKCTGDKFIGGSKARPGQAHKKTGLDIVLVMAWSRLKASIPAEEFKLCIPCLWGCEVGASRVCVGAGTISQMLILLSFICFSLWVQGFYSQNHDNISGNFVSVKIIFNKAVFTLPFPYNGVPWTAYNKNCNKYLTTILKQYHCCKNSN